MGESGYISEKICPCWHHLFSSTVHINIINMNHISAGIITIFCFALANSGRLGNNYLPPSAVSPSSFGTRASNVQNTYAPPAANNRPNNNYLPPSYQPGIGASGLPSIVAARTNAQYSSGPSYNPNGNAAILRLNNENNGDGTYSYELETENGIFQQESGQLQHTGPHHEQGVLAAQGSYSYTSPEGVTFTVNYLAGENGFQATGQHLPTPPPVPEEILKALEINAAHEAAGIFDDGQYRSENQGPADSQGSSGYPSPSRQYLGPRSNSNAQAGYQY